jgi:putative tryptophan/tyrosine transport system substrate-binding protein
LLRTRHQRPYGGRPAKQADELAASHHSITLTASGAAIRHRDLVITLAARHKLPAVYWERFFIAAGGLVSYGADLVDQYRRAAGYVDRIPR